MELRLIPEFSGDATQNVVDCLEKAELVCNLRGITHLESFIPLGLVEILSWVRHCLSVITAWHCHLPKGKIRQIKCKLTFFFDAIESYVE